MLFLSQISSLQFSTRRQTKTVLEEIIQGTQKPQLLQCRKHPYKWTVYTFTYIYYVSGTEGTVPKYNPEQLQFQTIRLRKGHRSHIHYLSSRTIFKVMKHDQIYQIITTPNNVHLSSGATNIYQL